MPGVLTDVFGQLKDGTTVTRYTMQNNKGMVVRLLTYGALVSEINIPDKHEKVKDIALGFDDIPGGYDVGLDVFVGAICGRVANRISGAEFTLDGNIYKLYENFSGTCLHGGKTGYHKRNWKGEVKGDKVTMTYISSDGEENFPGELTARVTYSLGKDENSLILEYQATTTKPTILNLTNHTYFNLGGHETGHLNDHMIKINSGHYLASDHNGVPTGEIRSVDGSEYDLRNFVNLGEQLKAVPGGAGFDTSFVLNNNKKLTLAARVEHPPTGNVLECYTTEPSVHLYTSHYFPNLIGKGGVAYKQNGSFCLEAQHYIDSIHHDNFPSTVVRPGDVYTQTTIYNFTHMD